MLVKRTVVYLGIAASACLVLACKSKAPITVELDMRDTAARLIVECHKYFTLTFRDMEESCKEGHNALFSVQLAALPAGPQTLTVLARDTDDHTTELSVGIEVPASAASAAFAGCPEAEPKADWTISRGTYDQECMLVNDKLPVRITAPPGSTVELAGTAYHLKGEPQTVILDPAPLFLDRALGDFESSSGRAEALDWVIPWTLGQDGARSGQLVVHAPDRKEAFATWIAAVVASPSRAAFAHDPDPPVGVVVVPRRDVMVREPARKVRELTWVAIVHEPARSAASSRKKCAYHLERQTEVFERDVLFGYAEVVITELATGRTLRIQIPADRCPLFAKTTEDLRGELDFAHVEEVAFSVRSSDPRWLPSP